MEEIRQWIKSKTGKINRYDKRVKKYQQDSTFSKNDEMFYKILNGDSNNENANSSPDENEIREFWKKNMGY